jgi:L-fucose mutarotase/ribose pyranase (RbsD/FucU family)
MLKGINPLLNADVLHALRATRHGDELISIERYAFYERAKQAYSVIQTGERRFDGCFAFRKGVISPDAR